MAADRPAGTARLALLRPATAMPTEKHNKSRVLTERGGPGAARAAWRGDAKVAAKSPQQQTRARCADAALQPLYSWCPACLPACRAADTRGLCSELRNCLVLRVLRYFAAPRLGTIHHPGGRRARRRALLNVEKYSFPCMHNLWTPRTPRSRRGRRACPSSGRAGDAAEGRRVSVGSRAPRGRLAGCPQWHSRSAPSSRAGVMTSANR